MKLRTSFFNRGVLRKDITRFAPVWGLYTVFMLMTLFLLVADENEPARFAANTQYIMQAMGVVNFFYGGICAILLFGDLFQSKMAGMLHAMPMRREGWFLTHLAAGMLFCLIPNMLGALFACVFLQQYCYLAFLWLAIVFCQFLFFFGAGAFAVQCAGNRLGAAAVYGLFNFLSVLAAFLVYTFYAPILYGVVPNWERLCRYAPAVGFSQSQYVSVEYDNMDSVARLEGLVGRDWGYLFAAVAVGIALLVLAVLLYRRRQLESAGDFIAVKPAGPVFLVIYTLCVGAAFYFVADVLAAGAQYLFLLIGFAVGFFTGHMLLEKKVHVFQLKKWIGLGVLTLAFFFTIALTWLDPAGITRYVPEGSQIQQIHLSPYASEYYLENKPLVLTDSQDILAITQIHKELIQNPGDETGSRTIFLRLRYKLKNGTTVDRRYYVDADSKTGQALKGYFSSFQAVTGEQTVQALVTGLDSIRFHSYTEELPNVIICRKGQADLTDKYGEEDWVTFEYDTVTGMTERSSGLLEALAADCATGNAVQQWEYHSGDSIGSLYLQGSIGERYSSVDITIFEECANTVESIKKLSFLAESLAAGVTVFPESLIP